MSVVELFRPIRSLYRILRPQPWSTSNLLTPLDEAVAELERRRTDKALIARVEAYLEQDIPEHFSGEPILYLARHVAAANFETLRFLHLVEAISMPAVIGQDLEDRFVPKNQLKKALGKLPISTGISMKDGQCHERYEYVNIIDFSRTDGKKFSEIETLWGESLSDFHAGLFKELANHTVQIVDESAWINRTHRGNLLAHYKKFLALFIVHGILFEDYALEDKEEARFIEGVLRPAFRFVEREFGCRPLIAQLTPTSVESPTFWISYPKRVLDIVREKSNATEA
jgi:hypothetical protein